MSHLCQECEICVQLKKGIVPRALDFGYAPCSAALKECQRKQNSAKPNPQIDLVLGELSQGHMVMEPSTYYADTDSDEDEPIPDKLKNELPPREETCFVSFLRYVLCQ